MFEYNSSANIKRKFFHPNNWSTLVRDNLDEGKPLLYAGENETSGHGHAFVCDGYRSDNTFHFNWGWRGLYNDYWLVLSSLSFSSYDYSDKQKAIFDIYPSNYYDYCDFSLSLEVYFSLYIFSSNPSIAVPRTFNVLQSVNRNSSLDAMYRTIPTGADIEYVAHQKVILVDGFHAEEGSHFVSYIDECEKCEEEDRLAERVGNIESFMEVKPSETESNIDNKVNIIPNPNNGSFCVSLTNNDEITGIKVFDTMGKIIYSNNRFNGGEVVLPDVKHGVYYVIVTLKDKTITEKIIIQ